MHPIKTKVVNYLERSNTEAAGMSKEIIARAGQAFMDMLEKQFNEKYDDEFKLRMSNIGKPTCQLQMKANKAPKENEKYSFPMVMMIGHMHEMLAIAIMEAAGVEIEALQEKCELDADGTKIKGSSDVTISKKIWDVKSCSPWSFEHKFSKGFAAVAHDDAFGYVGQGFGYAEGSGKKFGGWIAINKTTGEWEICEAPEDVATHEAVIKDVKKTVRTIVSGAPFKRSFNDVPEKFRKTETGNRTLKIACQYCAYKWTCWEGLKFLPSIPSSAKNPDRKYYTFVKEKESDNVEC